MEARFAEAARAFGGIASLRPWALRALVLGAGVLGAYHLTRRPKALSDLAGLGTLTLLAAGILWANSRPMLRMERQLETILRPRLTPEGLRLLPFGGSWPANELDIAVTAHELTGPDGSRLAWSAGEQSLIDFLLNAYAVVEHRPARLMRKQDSLIKGGWRTLTLALDERMTTHQLRRLLAASSAAKLHTLILLTKRDRESQADVSGQLRAMFSHHPFLQRLGALMDARPGAVEVYLPQAFNDAWGTRPAPPLWVGEVGPERALRLSQWPPRKGQEALVLTLEGSEKAVLPSTRLLPHLYLHVKEETALIDVAHAIRRARAHQFQVVLTVTPPPAEVPEP